MLSVEILYCVEGARTDEMKSETLNEQTLAAAQALNVNLTDAQGVSRAGLVGFSPPRPFWVDSMMARYSALGLPRSSHPVSRCRVLMCSARKTRRWNKKSHTSVRCCLTAGVRRTARSGTLLSTTSQQIG